LISIFKSSVSAHLATPSIITPIQRHTGLSVHSCLCDQRTLVGPVGHLGRVDAGQADREALAAVIDAQGVAVADREHGGRLGGESEQQGEGKGSKPHLGLTAPAFSHAAAFWNFESPLARHW
jgi:hypothetical protein